MAVVDSLLITLGLDPSGVNKGMNEAESRMKSGVQHITQNILAPLLGIFAVGGLVSGYLSSADAVGKLSDSLGIDVEAMQAWGEAASRAGGSAEGFEQSVKSLNEKVTEFATTGGGEGKDVFAALGVAAKDASGNARASLDVMLDMADQAEKMDKARFVGLAQKLGIDHGTIMLLQSGRKAVEELVARQKELGVYTRRDTEVAAAANDALADLGQAFKAGAAIILRVMVPALTFVSGRITALVVFLRKHEPFVLAALGAITTVLTARLIPASIKLAAAWLANPMVWIIAALVAAAVALGLVFDDLYAYMTGGNAALADFWALFGTGEELSQALGAAWNALKTVGETLWGTLTASVRLFFASFSRVFSGLGTIVRGVLQIIKGLFTADFKAIAAGLGTIFDGVKIMISGVFTGALDFVRGMWTGFLGWILGLFGTSLPAVGEAIVAAFSKAVETVRGMFSALIDTIMGWIQGILDKIPSMDSIKSGAKGAWNWATGALGFGNDAPAAPTSSDAARVGAVAERYRTSNVSTTSTTNVGTINVQTQASDARGVAGAIGGELSRTQERNFVMAAQTGTVTK